MKELNILNVYQINMLQHLLFMFQVKSSKTPRVFNQVFSLISHLHLRKFLNNSFKICDFNLKLTRFSIAFTDPRLWNKFLTESESVILALMYLKT